MSLVRIFVRQSHHWSGTTTQHRFMKLAIGMSPWAGAYRPCLQKSGMAQFFSLSSFWVVRYVRTPRFFLKATKIARILHTFVLYNTDMRVAFYIEQPFSAAK